MERKQFDMKYEYGTMKIAWVESTPDVMTFTVLGYTVTLDLKEIEGLHMFLTEVLDACILTDVLDTRAQKHLTHVRRHLS